MGCNGWNNNEGSIEVNAELSAECSLPGKVCIDYTLPEGDNPSLELQLEVIQNETIIATLNSQSLTSGTSYCFHLDENDINGYDYSLSGYDYKVTGFPKLGAFSLSPKFIGNSIDGYISGTNNDCLKYNLPICCPPFDTLLLRDLFNHVSLGSGLSSPFELQFNHNSYFTEVWQAYVNFLVLIDPTIEDLAMHVRLIDAGNGSSPNDVYSPMVEDGSQTWIWFQPGQNGNIFGNTAFFNTALNINHWYKIHTGIYTVPNSIFKDKNCPIIKIFYKVQLQGNRLIGIFSDGKKEFLQIDLKESDFMKKKS